MKISRTTALMRLLCTVVLAVACAGLLATGAFAYNTAITRTPVETLTYGTFTATLTGDGLQPAEDGSYTLATNEAPYNLTLHTEGNLARAVLLEITADEGGGTQQYYAAPSEEDVHFTVATGYNLTLRVTVLEAEPEETLTALTADTTVAFTRPQESAAEPSQEPQPADEAGETPAQSGQENTSDAAPAASPTATPPQENAPENKTKNEPESTSPEPVESSQPDAPEEAAAPQPEAADNAEAADSTDSIE